MSSLSRANVANHGHINVPARVAKERFPAVWVAAAAFALLLGGVFWSGRSHPAVDPSKSDKVEPDRQPKLAEGTPPEAPTATGAFAPTVLLRVLVGTNGQVREAEVQAPRPEVAELEKKAVEAVHAYRFLPAIQKGKPTEVWMTFPMRFKPVQAARQIAMKGSDTIGGALGPAWAKAFEASHSGLTIQVEALGSSTAFAGLLDGSAEIGAASRPIRSDELAFAAKIGVQLLEVVAAYDGIAVIVHPDNPVKDLSVEAVARIFAQQVTNWTEVGGSDAPIHVLGRPSYSGTHGFFKERVLSALEPPAPFGESIQNIEHSKDLVERVALDANAIGYVSIGHVLPSVRSLAISPPGKPAVAPVDATIRDGSYPVSRPLFLYLRSDSGHDARAFVDFTLSPEGQSLVQSKGFVPLDAPNVSSLADEMPSGAGSKPEILRVYFDQGSAGVPASAQDSLRGAAAVLRGGRRALIVGNADAAGQDDANRKLAERRAEAVAAKLRAFGSGDAPIAVEVADSQHPLATNSTSEGRSENRRVDVMLLNR